MPAGHSVGLNSSDSGLECTQLLCYDSTVDKAAVKQLCTLARIDLSASEEEEFATKFNSLLSFVEQLLAYNSPDAPSEAEKAERASAEHQLELRLDKPSPFVWPEGSEHNYRVRRVINFEGGD